MITIEMKFTNEFGHTFGLSETCEVYDSFDSELGKISRAVAKLCEHIGYAHYGDKQILMEPINEDEEDYLLWCLEDYRTNKKKREAAE